MQSLFGLFNFFTKIEVSNLWKKNDFFVKKCKYNKETVF